jgi:hypothetical protein
MGKQIAIGLSFANLCYLRVWAELLSYTPAQTYEMRLPPQPHDYVAVSLNVALWGAVFGLLAAKLGLASPATPRPAQQHLPAREQRTAQARQAARVGQAALVGQAARVRQAAQWLFLLSLLVPLNALRAVLASGLPFGQQYLKGGLYSALGPVGFTVFATAAAAGGLFALQRRREQITRIACFALLVFAPFVPLTIAQAAWKACRYDARAFDDRPTAPRLQATTQPLRRVVWVIFDEWDQRLCFDDRPEHLALPEIDRFRGVSFAATNAYPPGPTTLESMPALITGRVVAKAEPRGPAELRLTLRGGPTPLDWRQAPNVFDAARELGFDTALVGVYHPYCRVLANSLTSCWWTDMPRPINSNGETLGEAMRGQTRSLFETWRLSAFGQSLSTARKAREFPRALERAAAAAADPAYGLVLAHLLTPHFPHAWDRRTETFTLGNAPLRGYYDSLALTDRALGRLRRAMEAAGVWDSTTVLLSSDHAMKHAMLLDGKADQRVPFLLKFAGQSDGMAYEPAFNTVLTRDLLLDILRGKIANAREASQWLDGRQRLDGRAKPPAWSGD